MVVRLGLVRIEAQPFRSLFGSNGNHVSYFWNDWWYGMSWFEWELVLHIVNQLEKNTGGLVGAG
jgi:hypothetical protein